MKQIQNPAEFRQNITAKLQDILGDNETAMNLEKGIYNHSIAKAKSKCVVRKWDNPYFAVIYLDLLRTIFINLRDENILQKMKSKEIQALSLIHI